MSDAKLVCRDVWKLYGPGAKQLLKRNSDPDLADVLAAELVPAVRAANLEVHSGEIFVIMGLSGSGKSTLLRCMSRLIEPTQGELIFEGQDLLAASKSQMIDIRRHKMGMVFQHFALLPHLSVLENVAFPLDIQGQDKKQREIRAREIIELVGLAGREDNLPHELSGGQQQRVGIARSLVVEPEIWFLDEPFSALDPLIRREMQDEFLRLQAKLKKSIVFITHDFDESIRLADRIAIMKEGAIIQVASPEELVLNPATDYVAEFTRYVPRDKVISVSSIMQAHGSALTVGEFDESASVRSLDKIADISSKVFDAEKPVSVVDDNGVKVGSIDRTAIIDFLVSSSRTQQ
ncbi:MAG: ATP-binding cassette domain-containing protein [Granulosicoccus sp.]|nr:ATP-binding cassette domain-containing protein [Granulosicoccus sp.]